ncbi:SDR family oxidoreductase [Allonocardiopsis opalescens]|uniref:NAD(P)-dependent dehydrogenase (Short-subunit alcohol dehydrogenase family) n=1 Tax=Allonocardiopsis opalescens TaxID=1144618 RepID=A0A2T0QDH0_9ACTN|nr:SDR family oxidoreductase [Allonocardiopsis opalescens]PRY01994.1 NAD(P)-dependent dehydrogenase (short-subunit alcohol dehydrogenase family) [Allonocardiopsis opalescens]
MKEQPLYGRVALVAGATRGAGRGIAVELGAAGATVYCTGRTTRSRRSEMNRPETIEETAELVGEAGGRGVAVAVDHLEPGAVGALVERIDREHGRLDVLVNDVWGGDPLTAWGVPLWEHSLADGLRLLRLAVDSHIITSAHALPLLVRRPGGLVIEVTDGTDTGGYRGSFYYDLAKSSVIRMAAAQAAELRPHGGSAVALTPGFLRSEAMLDHFGVTADTWRKAADPHFRASETPAFVGRAAAALAADPDRARWSGQALSSWGLAREYGFTDSDGTRPDWGRYFEEVVLGGREADDTGYR